jgi:very-short-patch-repair endonuclease
VVKRLNVDRARALRTSQTDAERALWRHLRGRHFLGWKFRRQHEIGLYIADFVCADKWLIVELDGGQHVERADQDAVRAEWLCRAGYRVLRFWNDDVLKNTDDVLEQIQRALELDAALRTPPHPGPLPGGERGRSA